MSAEVVGYTPNDVVRAIKENAPPTTVVSDAEWSAWAGEAGEHERLHTMPSRNHPETMNVVWEYGVITSTLALYMPDFINETYMTMQWVYFEVATGAFVQPLGGFSELPAQVIAESAEAVGKDAMSDPDWATWKSAHASVIREEWEQRLKENQVQQDEENNSPLTEEPEAPESELEEPDPKNESGAVTQDVDPNRPGVIFPQQQEGIYFS